MGQVKRVTNQGFECEVEGCEEEAICCGLCANCYSAEKRWAERSVAERRERRGKLKLYQNRLDRLSGPPKLKFVR